MSDWPGFSLRETVRRVRRLHASHTGGDRQTGITWNDHLVPLSSTKAAGTNDPTWTKFRDNGSGSTGVFAWSFSKSAEQELFFSAQLPHDYQEGTDLRPHLHWAVNVTTSTGAVVWGLEYVIANPVTGTFGTTTLDTVTYTFTEDRQYDHILSSFTEIDGSAFTISHVLIGRLYRDADAAGDTFDDSAFALSFDIHYQIDAHGSTEETSK